MYRDRNASSGLNLNLRPRFRALTTLILATFIAPMNVYAQSELTDPEFQSDGMVDIYYPTKVVEPYRDRRGDWSVQFSINSENFYPNSFVSKKDTFSYGDLFGKTNISLFQASVGSKYNFPLGAITMDLSAATGTVASTRSGTARELSITKKAIAFGWTLDAIMKEPYVAPYIQGQILEFDYNDKGSINGNSSGRTAYTTGYTAGLLIQLNSMDPTDTALVANSQYGLNNTYVDLFATQYNTSNASNDPQLQSALNWGAGLKLEF